MSVNNRLPIKTSLVEQGQPSSMRAMKSDQGEDKETNSIEATSVKTASKASKMKPSSISSSRKKEPRKWTTEELKVLSGYVKTFTANDKKPTWESIASKIETHSHDTCLVRARDTVRDLPGTVSELLSIPYIS
ncbi:hypothetical protein COB11_00145 [Candidatus Aerophobetes bacterium]|uniref:Myb-like domain-containing protein n=1 Tax=Aerophobetes bacterium TaxID=2030807 RepID=A0A2A4YPA2_UNCAE|nr:MAG: hypothetical protein COB11_00145 [Candidatus Aerophobetes bacterium]